MYRIFAIAIAIAANVGCATPTDFSDTGDLRTRDGIPSFSDANEAPVNDVCYPGDPAAEPLCLPLHPSSAAHDGYLYPQARDPRYQTPTSFIDLHAIEGDARISENMQLGEIAEPYKGQWAVVQPHLVEKLQAIRDAVGPLVVASGYRSPAYNRHVGGAEHSRHMYGDAVDIYGLEASLPTVVNACKDLRASYIKMYDSHVHCDWRDEPLDEEFFGRDHHDDHDHPHDSLGKTRHIEPESEDELYGWTIETFAG